MQFLIAVILLTASTFSVLADETNVRPSNRIGEYVELPGAVGFLKYSGEHSGISICALSSDIGSAVPWEDFRLYAKQGNTYRQVLSLPMLTRKGYRCIVRGDTLSVYVTHNLEERRSTENGKPLVVIDLQQIIKAIAEQPGAGQPATPPADKVPPKDQPSTPTSKDAPR